AADLTAQVTIAASGAERHIFRFTTVPAAIAEGGAATVTVTRSGPALQADDSIQVRWAVLATADARAADFAGDAIPSGSINFTSARDAETFTVTTAQDTVNEARETFFLELSVRPSVAQAHGGVGVDSRAAVAITDDDPLQVAVSVASATLNEGDPATFQITLAGGSRAADVTIRPRLARAAAGVAATADDFAPPAGSGLQSIVESSVIAPQTNATSLTVLTVRADDLAESVESFAVEFTAAAAGAVEFTAGQRIELSIAAAADSTAAFATDAAAGVSIDEGAGAALRVTLSAANAAEARIPYRIAVGGEVAPPFMDPGGGMLVIPAGDTGGDINLRSLLSARNAGAGTLTVTLGAPTVGRGGGTVTASATARAAVVTVQFHAADRIAILDPPADTALDEGESAELMVRLSGAPPAVGSDVTVNFSVGGTVESSDYAATPAGGSVTFTNADPGPKTVNITATDDDLNEAAETLTVTLAAAEGAPVVVSRSMAAAELTIAESDPITYSIATGTPTVAEGGPLNVNVSLSAASEGVITVPFTLGGSAVIGSDINDPISYSIEVSAGITAAGRTLSSIGDTLNEADKTVIFTAGATPNRGPGAGPAARSATEAEQSATVTITDDDPVTVALAADAASAAEGTSATFTVTATGGTLTDDLTLTYSIGNAPDQTAITAADYADAGGGSVTFTHTETPFQISLDILSDLAAEPEETLVLTLESAASAGAASVSASAAAAQITIPANAASVRTITVTGPAGVTETDSALQPFYSMRRTGAPFTAPIVIHWTISHAPSDSGAGTVDADFAAVTGSFTFTDREITAHAESFAISIVGDNINEATENFTLQVAAADPTAQGGIAVGAAQATAITDDDPITAVISVVQPADPAAQTVAENGGAARFRIGISGGVRSADVTVPFTLAGLEAAEFTLAAATGLTINEDGLGGELVFAQSASAAATVTADLNFTMVDDALNEPVETFTLSGAAAGATGLRTAGAIAYVENADAVSVRVADDDPVTVAFAGATTATINEGGAAEFTVQLSGASAGSVTVVYSVTAAAGSGPAPTYNASAHPVIAAGDTTATIRISTPLDAMTDSGDATLTARITSVTTAGGGAVSVGAAAQAVITVNYIAQTRTLSVAVVSGASVDETDADLAHTFHAARVGQAFDADVTVTWTITHAETAGTADADFAAVTGTFNFPAAAATAAFEISVAGDNLNEPTENFSLQLSLPDAVAADTAIGAAASVAVNDDDDLTVTFPAEASVTEGDAFTLSAGISGGEVNGEVRLTWAAAVANPATATAADFTPVASTVLTADDAADTFDLTVQTTEDALAESGEAFVITATATAAGAVTVANAPLSVAITDDDPVTLGLARTSAAGAVAEDGGDLEYEVSLSSASSLAFSSVTVSVAAAPGGGADGASAADWAVTAPAGFTVDADAGDRGRGSLTLTDPDGNGVFTGLVRIALTDDALLENAESFSVTTAAPGAGGTNSASDTVTITDDESAAVAVARTDDDGFTEGGAEGEATAEFTVSLSGATLSADAAVAFSVANCGGGNCTVAPASPLTITPGADQNAVITITAGPDDAIAEAQNIGVTVTAVTTPGSVTGLPATATAQMEEDDFLEVGVTAAAAEVTESAGASVVFKLALSTGDGGATEATTVTYTLGGDAARGTDYTGHGVAGDDSADAEYTAVIAAGDTSAQLSFALAADSVAESDETLSVTLTAVAAPGYRARPLAADATAQSTILDAAPYLAVTCAAITETDADQPVTCTVTRTRVEFAAETTVN
ncbi:MAG: hypothetical protein OXE47_03290, partial [Gammaproteobacteria bacterium]|nr:hypothetical protein [Gammaproteobacteria bacterium]